MTARFRSFVVVACVCVLLLAPGLGAVQAAPGAPGEPPRAFVPVLSSGSPQAASNFVLKSENAAAPVDTAAYWTAERMMAAEPLDLLLAPDVDLAAVDAADAAGEVQGASGVFPSKLPDPKALALAQELYADQWAMLEEIDAAGAPVEGAAVDESLAWRESPPFTRYSVNYYGESWKQFPYKAMGRLFFTIPGRGNASCSASSAGGRSVWTAGHCLYTREIGWHTNIVFVPAYRYGVAPYGKFYETNAIVSYEWWANEDHAYDIGMVIVGNRNGMKLSQWVGNLGFQYNRSGTQQFFAFGYPGNIGSGRYLIACAARTQTRYAIAGPDPVGIGCDMTQGSSGGPWLVGFFPYAAGSINYVNGVVSFGSSAYPNQFFASYFGTRAKELWDWGRVQ